MSIFYCIVNFIESNYMWWKALHVISVICWMAAAFYMPRLFVYHSLAKKGSEIDKTFQIMEHNLLKKIMNPSMIATYIFGIINLYIYGMSAIGLWFYIKLIAIIGLTIVHLIDVKCVKNFANNNNTYSSNFYRIFNEVPVILMIVAVIMVIVKPFD